MRKILIIGFVALLSVVLAYGFADAKVQGPCVDCHTMHNSQNNIAMTFDGGGPYEALLKGSCLGCHGQNPSGTLNIITNTPQVLHSSATPLAGGNFGYITLNEPRDGTDTGANASSVGHNVRDLGATYYEGVLSTPPGDELSTGVNATSNFTCAGSAGCHGDRSISGSYLAVKSSHHASDTVLKFGTIDEGSQGGTTALSYRFLKGVKGGEQQSWLNSTSAVHNEYKGAASRGSESGSTTPGGNTISGLCAECHGNFHGTGVGDIGTASPWVRHPTDIVLPTTGEYASYTGATAYNVLAIVGRQTIPNAISQAVTPGVDTVTCLSCHMVHASANADILRWNYSTISAGTGSDLTRCFICHTTKDTP